MAVSGSGQSNPATRLAQTAMQQHYDAAFRLQDAGNLEQADAEHRLFLAAALHRIANARANLGEYARAVPVYEQALQCAADDRALQLDYATAALDAGDWTKAKQMAQNALSQLPNQPGSQRASATLLLAQALWGAGEREASLASYQAAAAILPTFDTAYALARTYLGLSDKQSAAKVFAGILTKFGDTATIHMQFGRAYALANFFPDAVEEFNKALTKDDRLQGAHYSLGAAYLQLQGEQGYPQAEVQFRRELALHPNDTFTYPQWGRLP